MVEKPIVKGEISYPEGKLILDSNGWRDEPPGSLPKLLEHAKFLTLFYEPSPAHGYPGVLLARQVAEATGGKFKVGGPFPFNPDVVY